MRTRITLLLGALALMTGCASGPSVGYASPDFSAQGRCERAGGYWNRTANVCEIQRMR